MTTGRVVGGDDDWRWSEETTMGTSLTVSLFELAGFFSHGKRIRVDKDNYRSATVLNLEGTNRVESETRQIPISMEDFLISLAVKQLK
ncbi:uncharacterized protein J3R85_003782 [Psidium guajava]|nr:uncharacterized protein J3R85_003782 [Psidium guajava]